MAHRDDWDTVELVFPSSHEYLSLVNAVAEELVMRAGADSESLDAIGSSVIEACTNAIEHGNKKDRKKDVRVRFRTNGRTIEIEVSDQGAGFDLAAIQDPRTPENLMRERGRGIFILRAFMDEVRFDIERAAAAAERAVDEGSAGDGLKERDCLLDEQFTLGLQIIDPLSNTRFDSLAYQVIEQQNRRRSLAEEMRILYVAMTRAIDRLILEVAARFALSHGFLMDIFARIEASTETGDILYSNHELPPFMGSLTGTSILPFLSPTFMPRASLPPDMPMFVIIVSSTTNDSFGAIRNSPPRSVLPATRGPVCAASFLPKSLPTENLIITALFVLFIIGWHRYKSFSVYVWPYFVQKFIPTHGERFIRWEYNSFC